MADPVFDHEVRAELLCHLVVAQLIAHAHTGAWLRTDHLVESTRIWLADRKLEIDGAERIDFAQASDIVAKAMGKLPGLQNEDRLAKLFGDGWRLDYQLAIVQGMLDVCSAYLLDIQVRENPADTGDMDSDRHSPAGRSSYSSAFELEMSVRATRRVQGKKNPEDLPAGSPEWTAVTDDFLLDLHRARGGDFK